MEQVSTFLAWLERQRAERAQLERAMHHHGVTKARVQFLQGQARRIDRTVQMGQIALRDLFLAAPTVH